MLAGAAAGCVAIEISGYLLRQIHIEFNPLVWATSQIIAALLGFTIAANVLLRFYGTGDRISLLLGLGVGLVGFIQLGGILELPRHLSNVAEPARVPLYWMVGGLLFALLLVVTPFLDKHLPWPRDPRKTVAAALTLAGVGAALVALPFLAFSYEPAVHPASILPRPWDLVIAGIFIVAAIVSGRRSHPLPSAFGNAVTWTAATNAMAYLVASQSGRLLDAPAVTAQFITISSYALLLAVTLLDNVHLFGQVRHRATSDSLTGLANHERFLEVLQNELERSGRTNRHFSLLLMDMDGLKQINDAHGHLTGSESICRIARILQQECRSIDTAARYGGDEFGLILPETGEASAKEVATRICKRVVADPGHPPLNLSVGTATHPGDGLSMELLIDAADRKLYAAKARSKTRKSLK
jgi:diguanylate cyclase (GGDEF)-like protein